MLLPGKMKPSMKTRRVLLGVLAMMAGIGSVPADAQPIYVGCDFSGTVEEFDSSGNHSSLAINTDSWGLACDGNGDLYVSAIQGQTIYRFDSSGNRSIFASGVTRPSGLTFDSSGNLYVARQSDGSIERFDSSGNGSVIASGLYRANWLAFDGTGNLFVTTYKQGGGSAIIRIDSSGSQSSFFSTGSMIDFFGLTFDASGNLYASTGSGGTILKFDPTGQESVFASGLGFVGNCAFDSSGNLYATSGAENGMVLKFDSSGQESVFASGLYAPLGIAVAVVPEPTSLAIFGLGLISLRFLRWRRR